MVEKNLCMKKLEQIAVGYFRFNDFKFDRSLGTEPDMVLSDISKY